MMKLAFFSVVFVFAVGYGVEALDYSAISQVAETNGAPATKTECFDVLYSVEKICTKTDNFQEVYKCPSHSNEYESVESFIEVPSTCYRVVEKEILYKCPKQTTKKVCFNMPTFIPKICSKLVTKKVTQECPKKTTKRSCQLVPKEFSGTCIEIKSYSEPYDCWTTEEAKECDLNVVTTCTREVIQDEPYEYEELQAEEVCLKCVPEDYSCSETIYEQKCENLCDQTTYKQETYDCSVTRTVETQCNVESCVPTSSLRRLSPKKSCRKGEKISKQLQTSPCTKEVIIPKSCTRSVPVTINEACTSSTNKCSMVPVVKPKKCEKPQNSKQAVECAVDCKNVRAPVKKTGYKKVVKTESYPCDVPETKESCYEIKKLKKDTCYATLLKAVEKECLKQKFEQVCENVETDINFKCIKDEKTEFSYSCPEHSTEEKCVSITVDEMQTCSTNLPVSEEYPCTERQPTIARRAKAQSSYNDCLRDVTKPFSYKCYETARRQECVSLVESRKQLVTIQKKNSPTTYVTKPVVSSKTHSGHSSGSSRTHSGGHSSGSSRTHSGGHSSGSSRTHSGGYSSGSSMMHSGGHSYGSSMTHSGGHSSGSSKHNSGHSSISAKQHSVSHPLLSSNIGTKAGIHSLGSSKKTFTHKSFPGASKKKHFY